MLQRRAFVVALTLTLAPIAITRAEDAPAPFPIHASGDVAYFSGGVGSDERKQMDAMAGGFNVRVEIAAPGGEFQGGGHVRITNGSGKAVVDTTTNGPILFAKVPAGSYTIELGDGGTAQRKTVDAPASGRANAVFVMGDGSTTR